MPENPKKQAFSIIRKRNLCSYMNDTNWNELRNAILYEMPFPTTYDIKTLFEKERSNEKSLLKPTYHDDWYEGFAYGDCFNGSFAIEWLKINPCFLKHKGCLIEPEITDASSELEKILRNTIFLMKNRMIYIVFMDINKR